MSLDRIGLVGDVEKLIKKVGLRTAYIGDMGQGAEKDLSPISPEGGDGWEIVIPERGTGEEFQLSIALWNVRGLPDQEITRLIGKIAVFGGEYAADELIHFGVRVVDISKSLGLGETAFLLEHAIDEIFPDPPSCIGPVMKLAIPCNPEILAGRWEHPKYAGTSQVQLWRDGDLEYPSGSGCSRPHAEVQYTIKRMVSVPPFGSPRNTEYKYEELDTLRIDDIVNQWANTSDNSNPVPLVQVVIRRSNTLCANIR